MNEAGDIVSNLPAIILLSFWWAFLSTLDMFFRPGGFGETNASPTPPETSYAAPADPRLRELLALDPRFDAEAFLRGARRAYEEIVRLYAHGDLELLRPLLSAEVLAAFVHTCATRADRGETLELTFVGIDAAEIEVADVSADTVEIDVRFRAEIVSVVRSQSGAVLSGDPTAVIVTDELWTFSRPPGDNDAQWILVATA